MDLRVALIFCLMILVAAAVPRQESHLRDKRDVMETMKQAWGEVVRTFSDASDAVVHVFRPTEKSTIDKIADGVKGLTQ